MPKNTSNYNSLFYLTPLPCWRYELETFKILDFNKAVVDHYGYTETELLSLTLKDIVLEEESTQLRMAHTNIHHQDGNVNLGVFTHKKKSGDLIRVEINGHRADFEGSECIIAICQVAKPTIEQKWEVNQLMDASLDVFCLINEKGDFEYVSAAAETHWGYLPNELIGKPYMSLILEEDIPKTNAIAIAIHRGEEIKSFVNRYQKKDGSIAYNLWSARWDDVAKLMYCVARDTKDKIEEEEKTHQSELRFKSLVQEGSDLIGIIDKEGNYLYVSPTSTTILGIAPEFFVGKNALEFIHREDVKKTLASLQSIVTTHRVKSEPYRFQNKKGEWRWVETILTNMLDNPAVKGIVANSRDITDKIEDENRVILFEKLINSTADAVIITEAEPLDSPGPRITYVNEAFTQMTGYSREEVIGQNPRFLQGPDSNIEDLKILGEKLRRWESSEITVLNYTKTGEEFWTNFIVSPLADQNGWYTHWISIQRDVTKQINNGRAQDLLSQISLIFNKANDYYDALNRLCETLGKFGNFDWVELWTLSVDKRTMQLMSHYLLEPTDEVFYSECSHINAFEHGKSIPGQVWSLGKQLLWNDIDQHDDFVRRKWANKIGIKSTLGIPLLFQGKVIGVLLIGTKINDSKLNKYSWVLEQLEGFIGSEINRKKLENDLNHLYNTIPDIICLTDFEGNFLKINKSGCKLVGYDEEELINHNFNKFVHHEDKDISAKEVSRLGKGDTTFNFENRYITKSGSIIWLSWCCNSYKEEGIIYATGRNITEEKKLRELNIQTGQLAKIGSWELVPQSETLYWSEAVHQIHETDPANYTPDLADAVEFYRQDFHELVQTSIQNCITKGEEIDFESVIITANKKERWIRAMGRAEFNEGKCTRISGSMQDITDRKEAEIRLQTLADNLPGVVYQYLLYPDGQDALRFVSKGSQAIWGFPAEEVMKNTQLVWDQIQAGGQLEEFKESIKHSIETRTNWTGRWKYVMPNGEIRTNLGYGSPYYMANGTVLINSVILDITQDAANEELLGHVTKQAKIGSWEIDLTNNTLFSSHMVHSILEMNQEPQVSDINSFVNFFRDDFQSIVRTGLLDCLVKGISFDFEAVLLTASKNEKWVRIRGGVETIDKRNTKIYGSIQDIHVTKSLELKIREILGSISDAFFSVDKDLKFIYFNKEAERLLNLHEDDVIGKSMWDIFPDSVRIKLNELYCNIMHHMVPETFEILYPLNNKWYEVSAYPSDKGLSVYFKNINYRKLAAEKLQKAFEEKNKILESIGDAFFAVNADWTVTYWNKEAELVLGRNKDQMIGTKFLGSIYR